MIILKQGMPDIPQLWMWSVSLIRKDSNLLGFVREFLGSIPNAVISSTELLGVATVEGVTKAAYCDSSRVIVLFGASFTPLLFGG